ncbi:MAG: hypothetical protein JKY20_11445 [Alphaproteobacteria bacterium]|nr:hypothetical protein [Alphaproteobacteria bacterium]
MSENVQNSENLWNGPVTLAQYSAMDFAQKRDVWLEISNITGAEFDAHMAREKAREASVPKVGAMAPDFTADVLGVDGSRTGKQLRLSDLRGRPVGLVFGSYT